MKIFKALQGAVLGWRGILVGGEWQPYFQRTSGGLVTALVIYFLLAFIVMLVGGAGIGSLNPINIVVGLLVLGLYPLALAISAISARLVLKWPRPVFDLLVPGLYAISLYLLLGSALAVFGPAVLLALLIVAVLLFRLGRVVGEWNIGVSAAFAVFTALLLVAMPITLYMLTSPNIPAP